MVTRTGRRPTSSESVSSTSDSRRRSGPATCRTRPAASGDSAARASARPRSSCHSGWSIGRPPSTTGMAGSVRTIVASEASAPSPGAYTSPGPHDRPHATKAARGVFGLAQRASVLGAAALVAQGREQDEPLGPVALRLRDQPARAADVDAARAAGPQARSRARRSSPTARVRRRAGGRPGNPRPRPASRARRRRRPLVPRHPAAIGARPPPPRGDSSRTSWPCSTSAVTVAAATAPSPATRTFMSSLRGFRRPHLLAPCNRRAGRPRGRPTPATGLALMKTRCAPVSSSRRRRTGSRSSGSATSRRRRRATTSRRPRTCSPSAAGYGRAAGTAVPVGPGAALGRGPEGGEPAHQRSRGERVHAGRLPRLLPPAPLPRARAGVLRMEALRPRARAVAHPVEGGTDVRVRRSVGPVGRQRLRDRVLRSPHHRREPAGRAHPRPHARDPRSPRLRGVAGPGGRRKPTCGRCSSPSRRTRWRPSRCRRE